MGTEVHWQLGERGAGQGAALRPLIPRHPGPSGGQGRTSLRPRGLPETGHRPPAEPEPTLSTVSSTRGARVPPGGHIWPDRRPEDPGIQPCHPMTTGPTARTVMITTPYQHRASFQLHCTLPGFQSGRSLFIPTILVTMKSIAPSKITGISTYIRHLHSAKHRARHKGLKINRLQTPSFKGLTCSDIND